MANIVSWQNLNTIEDGCGGVIYKILDAENSGLTHLEIAMCIFSPREVATLHYHKRMEEIYFVLEGEGAIEINGKWHPLQAEDTVAIPIGVKHRIKNTSIDRELKFISINSPEWQETDLIVAQDGPQGQS